MKFLPIEKITYKTRLKEHEVIEKLMHNVEPESVFPFKLKFKSTAKPFEGSIQGRRFEIHRSINYMNSFNPQIVGRIQPDVNETTIKVTMYIHESVIFFSLIILIISVASIVFPIIYDMGGVSTHSFIPSAMLLFLYVASLIFFKMESGKSILYFDKLFESFETKL